MVFGLTGDGRGLALVLWRCGLLWLALLLTGCGAGAGYDVYQGATMGTVYRVSARCPADADSAIQGELALVNQAMSTYEQDSELSQFNQHAPNAWVPVSGELFSVMQVAQQLSRVSGGAFDVTVGPLVNAWGFGPAIADAAKPSAAELAAAFNRVGYEKLRLRENPPALQKLADVYVDLSAIAKGYGVDRVAERLLRDGCSDFMVEVGGEVTVRGVNPQGQPWRVGIEVPDLRRVGDVHRVLALRDMAVATSGDYRNYVEHDGQRYSHTIDPRNGEPVRHALASVTVIHKTALWADAYATAISVLGPEAGWRFAEAENLAALFIVRGANGFDERYTAPMHQFLQ